VFFNPPVIQHFDHEPALLITGFEGVPHVQSENVPPGTQLPFDVSKSSLYGKLLIGVAHCENEKYDVKERVIEKIVFTNGERRI